MERCLFGVAKAAVDVTTQEKFRWFRYRGLDLLQDVYFEHLTLYPVPLCTVSLMFLSCNQQLCLEVPGFYITGKELFLSSHFL